MSAAEELLPVQALTRKTLVRCDPYHSRLMAGACVDRRAEALAHREAAGASKHFRGIDGSRCLTCTVGAERAAQLPATAPVACAVCGEPVTGAQGTVPKCAKHKRHAARNNHAVRKP